MKDYSLWGLVATFISGVISGLLTEPIRNRTWAAGLRLNFVNDHDPDKLYFFRTPETWERDGKSIRYENLYIRFKVTNTSFLTAKNCLAYLTKIDYSNGRSSEVLFQEYMRLQWSYTGYEPINIAPKTEVFVALVTIDPYDKQLTPQTIYKPHLYAEQLTKPGDYTFTFKVIGDFITPRAMSVRLTVSQAYNGELLLEKATAQHLSNPTGEKLLERLWAKFPRNWRDKEHKAIAHRSNNRGISES